MQPAFVARELAPAGLRSDPNALSDSKSDDCCAAEREQAPSPQLDAHLLRAPTLRDNIGQFQE
jgi:hypothetical protein